MRKVPIEYVKSGDILGKTLYNNSGGMLLREGTILNSNLITKLEKFGCFSLYITDRYSEEEIEEVIKPRTLRRIHKLKSELENIIIDFNKGNKVDAKKINNNIGDVNKIIEEIIHDVVKSKSILEDLLNISVYDDYTLNHSLNVMMLSTVIAKDKSFTMEEIKKLALGCLYHDIGKTFLPIEIINKPSNLTDEEFKIVQDHTEKGFEFLRDYTNLPMTAINIALNHHEREDGSGYPAGRNGKEIHEFSKIASICDVFDALTSDRPYRRAVPVNEAMEYLYACGGQEFSLDTIKSFAKSINIFPKGTLVLLSDNSEGIVHEANDDIHTRPKIKVKGENGREVESYIIDLMEYNNIVIDKVLYKFSFQ